MAGVTVSARRRAIKGGRMPHKMMRELAPALKKPIRGEERADVRLAARSAHLASELPSAKTPGWSRLSLSAPLKEYRSPRVWGEEPKETRSKTECPQDQPAAAESLPLFSARRDERLLLSVFHFL